MSGSSSAHRSRTGPRPPASAPAATPAPAEGFTTASHDVLFTGGDEMRCDICGTTLGEDAESRGGRGAYLFARGDAVREEDAPLCRECGTAILASARARWEIEEDEG